MRSTTKPGKLVWFGASSPRRAAWQFLPVLAALLAGCTAGIPFQATPDSMRAPGVASAGSNASPKPSEESPATEKPAQHSPKTLPEALCAYWKCLHLPRSEREAAAQKETGNGANNHKEENNQSKPAEEGGKKSSPEA